MIGEYYTDDGLSQEERAVSRRQCKRSGGIILVGIRIVPLTVIFTEFSLQWLLSASKLKELNLQTDTWLQRWNHRSNRSLFQKPYYLEGVDNWWNVGRVYGAQRRLLWEINLFLPENLCFIQKSHLIITKELIYIKNFSDIKSFHFLFTHSTFSPNQEIVKLNWFF